MDRFNWSSATQRLPVQGPLWHREPSTIGAFQKVAALHPLFEVVGSIAACITTFAWVPQIMKILRERQARDISLATTATLATGVFLWVVYGIAIGSLPVILANGVSFLFIAGIVALKLRFG
jgi:MtN3 and saliva related transmembrane protein